MITPLVTEDFCLYTDRKLVNDLKSSSNLLNWKTHVESLKETVIEMNMKLCAEESNTEFMQPLGKKNIAAGMLYENFNHLQAKMRNFHNTENEMLKPTVTNQHCTWHENCHHNVKAFLKQLKL